MVKKGYERVDVTFSKTSDIEMQLYKYDVAFHKIYSIFDTT